MPFTDLYNMPASAIPGGSTINQVEAFAYVGAGRADGTSNARTSIKIGGTQYNGTLFTFLDTNYILISTVYATNPNSGVAWTVSDINALQVGQTLVGDTTPAFPRGTNYFPTACTQTYIETDYDAVAADAGHSQFNRLFNEQLNEGFN